MNEEMVSVKEEITSLLLSSTAEDSCTVHATVQDTGTVMYTYEEEIKMENTDTRGTT